MLSNDTFSKLALFKKATSETILSITKAAKLNFYKKGTCFAAREDRTPNFYYIVKGWVKLYAVSLNGSQIIRDILTDAHHFNEEFLFANQNEFLNAEALSDSEIISNPLLSLNKPFLETFN